MIRLRLVGGPADGYEEAWPGEDPPIAWHGRAVNPLPLVTEVSAPLPISTACREFIWHWRGTVAADGARLMIYGGEL